MNKLAIACELSLNDWLATFPDIIPEAECSKNHEKWKKKLFNKMRNDHYHRFTTKTIKVMLVAAILLALLMSAFVFPSSRESAINSLNSFSRFRITEDNKNSVNREIEVGYIPDGFELESKDTSAKTIQIKYTSNNGVFFTIWKCASVMEMNFNTEFFESEEIIVDNVKYVYCQGNEGVNNLVWTKNDYVYQVAAPFEKEELFKIARTVE